VERSVLRASADAVRACIPGASLVGGIGLGAAGYLVVQPGLAASGALVAAVGLYAERMQARALRRRRRAERMRNRHEVTELRRTIAQLRIDVDAFQRALLDTEAVLAAQSLPLLPPVPVAEAAPEPAAQVLALPAPETVPAAVVPYAPSEAPSAPVVATTEQPEAEPRAVVSIAQGWVQTSHRDVEASPLPAQQASPFVTAFGANLPVIAASHSAPSAADALVFAALGELEADEETRALAYGGAGEPEAAGVEAASVEARGAA
jgi:hypothetical protein